MHILYDIDLYKYNTMRLHSIARIVYMPHNRNELFELINGFKQRREKYHIVSGGSNIVFSEFVQTPIVLLMELDEAITILENNIVECGCSVRIQQLINKIKNENLGGIEYLFSVPTSVGGAIVMNAGRGRKWNSSISDYLFKIEYLDTEIMEYKIIEMTDGLFSYRNSIFQQNLAIVVRAWFRFRDQPTEITQNLITERLAYSKKYLSMENPSCGTVFCKVNPVIMRLLKGISFKGAMYSKKTPNWISNVNNATASDVRKLVRLATFFHKIFFLKCKTEIRFFE
ncbi:MAG: FAD-binding protein [Bacteroidales bacterium]|nr:FAD-binding protein [Bacteroidales bacterium]